MAQFIKPDRDQLLMLETFDLNSIATVGSKVYIIDQIVDRLDTSNIEKRYHTDISSGNPAIHPKTIIKVCLMAIENCRFTTRKMEEDTRNNLVYKYLTGNRVIDHSTIGKFLSKFILEIVELFSQIVTICQEENLIGFDILAIDTVKIKANASYKNTLNKKGLSKKKEKLKKKIKELIENADKTEQSQIDAINKKLEKIKKAEKKLSELIAEESKNKTSKEKIKIEGNNKINITDHDPSIMSQANGEHNVMYAISTGTDAKIDIITDFEVSGKIDDTASLFPVIDGSKEITGEKHEHYPADSGFASLENYETAEKNDIDLYVPDKRKEAEENDQTTKKEYDKGNFKYNRRTDTYKCPRGNKLYMVQKITGSDGRGKKVYSNFAACKKCLKFINACTRNKQGYRTITRDEKEDLKDKMRKKLNSKCGKNIYKKRSHVSESPYGNIKSNKKFKEFMRRGIDKVEMECALLFMLHNIMKLGKLSYA